MVASRYHIQHAQMHEVATEDVVSLKEVECIDVYMKISEVIHLDSVLW